MVKVETSEPGLYGLGCATFRQRAHAVVAAVDQYLDDFCKGKSVHDFGRSNGKMSASEIKKMLEPELVKYAQKLGINASEKDLKADTLQKVLNKLGLN